MKRIISVVLIGSSIMLLSGCSSAERKSPFNFLEVSELLQRTLPDAKFFKSSDNVELAYYPYLPRGRINSVVIFIHGGGAYSGVGYQKLAEDLSGKHSTAVYLLDNRGHGNSAGPRGDSPSIDQMWMDLKLFVQFIKKKHPDKALFLAGHSAGGGLILNYLTWYKDNNIKGYIFISPELGYNSNTARKDRVEFADAKLFVFIKNRLTGGRYGHEKAVILNYPEYFLKSQPKIVSYYTYNLSMAITLQEPLGQFATIDKPFGLFIGDRDELFDPEKLISYAELPKKEIKEKSFAEIVKGDDHLSILNNAGELIYEAINKISCTN